MGSEMCIRDRLTGLCAARLWLSAGAAAPGLTVGAGAGGLSRAQKRKAQRDKPLDQAQREGALDRQSPRVSYPPPTIPHWRSIDAILIVLATPGTGLGGKNRIYLSLVSCLGAVVW